MRRSLTKLQSVQPGLNLHSCASALVDRAKQKLAPRGELSVAHRRPPCDSTMDRLIRSPMPVPWDLVVKNALKIWSPCCAGSPTPVSLTVTRTCSFSAPCDLIASSRVPSTSFIASMPLSMRFISTCCNCTRSPKTGKLCRELRPDGYVVSCRLAAQEDDHLSNDFVYIHQLPFWITLLEEQPNPADDFRRTHSVFRASHGSRARFFHIWGVARQPANAGIGVGDGGANRLVHFVRQGSSQLSHGRHPADVCEIRLRLARSLFRPLAFPTFCLQRLVGSLELFNCLFQVIARAPKRFHGAPLCSAQRPDKQG